MPAGPSPRRLSVGLERDRLAMMLAVLHRHAGIAALDQDVFVNAVGGVRISEPAADLAVMLAIQSSLRGKAAAARLPRLRRGRPRRRGPAGAARPGAAARGGQARLLGRDRAQGQRAQGRGCARRFEGLTIHAVERIEEAIERVRAL